MSTSDKTRKLQLLGGFAKKTQVDELSEKIEEKVTAPDTVEAGQTIVVSEVDENGKPTAWAAKSVNEIAQEAAGLIDTALLSIIGTGEVTT